jgi:hypothetical protein
MMLVNERERQELQLMLSKVWYGSALVERRVIWAHTLVA